MARRTNAWIRKGKRGKGVLNEALTRSAIQDVRVSTFISYVVHLNHRVSWSNMLARAAATSEEQTDPTSHPLGAIFHGNAPPGAFIAPVGYPPGLPIIPHQGNRPGEGPTYLYIPVQVMAPPPSNGNGQDGESHHPLYPPSFYPGPYFNPYAQAHAYLMHSQRGADGPPHFGFGPVYSSPPQTSDSSRDGAEHRGSDSSYR